jgi:hypothetical protein
MDMLRLSETLKNFDIANTLCRDEKDKCVVISRIVETWGSIDMFNAFVRGPVTKSIAIAIGGRNYIYDIYAKAGTFLSGFAWMSLNSPGYAFSESMLGGLFFTFPMIILCTVLWFRVAALVNSWFPASPKMWCLVTYTLLALSCLMHAYCQVTLWFLANRLSERIGMGEAGGIMFFIPIVAAQFLVLNHYSTIKNAELMRIHGWSRFDTMYYAVVIACFFFLLATTNLASLLNKEQDTFGLITR